MYLSYLSSRAPEKLLDVEDANILTGNDLGGIINSATAFAAGDLADSVDNANEFDAIVACLNQLALANYNADTIH